MIDWMNEWRDRWMNDWIDGWMDGRKNGWMDEWMIEWMDRWMDERMNERTVGRVNEYQTQTSCTIYLFVNTSPPFVRLISWPSSGRSNVFRYAAFVSNFVADILHILLNL